LTNNVLLDTNIEKTKTIMCKRITLKYTDEYDSIRDIMFFYNQCR